MSANQAPTQPPTPVPAQPVGPQGHCRGYILSHQHPSVDSLSHRGTPADPYAVIPCPFPACAPAKLSTACAARSPSGEPSLPTPKNEGEKENIFQKKLKGGCAKARWCERHWCGGCKRASGFGGRVLAEGDGANGYSHGAVHKQEEGQYDGSHVKVQEVERADTPMPPRPPRIDIGEGMEIEGEAETAHGKTADLTLDCQMHLRGEQQASEPAHEIRL